MAVKDHNLVPSPTNTSTNTPGDIKEDKRLFLTDSDDDVIVFENSCQVYRELKILLRNIGLEFDGRMVIHDRTHLNLQTDSYEITINDYSDTEDSQVYQNHSSLIRIIIDKRKLRSSYYFSVRRA